MKQRIVVETVHLIQTKGFTFTISDLAKQLAVSKRTIYEHFSSKDEIVDEVIRTVIESIQEKEKSIAEDDTLQTIEKIRRILICIPQEFQFMDVRLLLELKKYHYNQWLKLDQFLRDGWLVVIRLMEEGMQEGSLREIQIPFFIELYLGALNRIYDPMFIEKNEYTLGSMLESVMDMLLYGISNQR
ncbi:TetR family transcriptional regulator [Bacillus pseudomycoides]|uniref:TetR family transcriptional regulator n=1 Tax=Bacillus pseudomycoides TaxID=64104 RepID=A0AA91VBZ3_9BACI|nr:MULTISPECIES: TetR/AcrR family transcriptional regulator [Bacillus]PEB51869.1 TetR family transcriptional regulator [Bacillus sp. AFS098217]PED81843.1 TetR family transcriptional regulator [Bacillus pseudomycoides]PEU15271.1 TetR family transcriptional regulator [Bacillus sp. AFS014408]PEU17874.1 TetR family transcriptional regulator [Bacillus sp. AFS019443]PFW63328.1 TetR family transcriptional regulator [Bacillus sp. AFS075034]